MSDKPKALQMADVLENKLGGAADDDIEHAAAELRRLHAEHAQLGQALKRAIERINELEALNAELLEALKHAAECVQSNYLPDKCGHDWDELIAKAEASK